MIRPGGLVIDSRDIDEYYNPIGVGGYRPVANTVWTWHRFAKELVVTGARACEEDAGERGHSSRRPLHARSARHGPSRGRSGATITVRCSPLVARAPGIPRGERPRSGTCGTTGHPSIGPIRRAAVSIAAAVVPSVPLPNSVHLAGSGVPTLRQNGHRPFASRLGA